MDRVVTIANGSSAATVLKGFTLSGGTAALEAGETRRYGSGLFIHESEPTLEDLVITSNDCLGPERCYGAGLAVVSSGVTMTDVNMHSNTSSDCERAYGVGAFFQHSAVDALRVQFDNNSASDCEYARGTGFYSSTSEVVLRNSSVRDNRTEGGPVDGFGFASLSYSAVSMENGVVAGNTVDATALDGVIWQSHSNLELINVSVVGNTGKVEAAQCLGIAFDYSGNDAFLVNVDVSENQISAAENDGGWLCEGNAGGNAVTVRYTNAWGNPFDDLAMPYRDGEGVMSQDPKYYDLSGERAEDWDLQIDTASPLSNAGDPEYRDPNGSRSDIGSQGGPGASDW